MNMLMKHDILFYQCKGAFAGVITVLTKGSYQNMAEAK